MVTINSEKYFIQGTVIIRKKWITRQTIAFAYVVPISPLNGVATHRI